MTLIGEKDYNKLSEVAKDYKTSREHVIELLFKYEDFSNPEIMKALTAKPVKKSVTINGICEK